MTRHVCRFRLNAHKTGTDYYVSLTNAFIPGKDTPKRVENCRNILSYTYGVFPQEEIEAVVAAGARVRERMTAIAKEHGLETQGYWGEPVAALTKYLDRPLPSIDYINFMGIRVVLPRGKGQKAAARKLYEALLPLQKEFAAFMDVEVETTFE